LQQPIDDPEAPSPVVGPTRPRILEVLGPGLITGASDDDPSGIATYAQAGAQFGFGLGWTMVLMFPMMTAVQMICARFGRVTGMGIAGVLRQHVPPALLTGTVVLLLIANVINLGADLGAMADATALLLPVHAALYVPLYAAICICMQLFLVYTRYVAVLKWLSLALLAYVVSVLTVHVDWRGLAVALVLPKLRLDSDYLAMLVAIAGTTISPYLFFWQAAEEVEDLRAYPRRVALLRAPLQGPAALHRIGIDTIVGMALSNLIGLAIIVTAASTLNVHGISDIQTSAQAAAALGPIAGRFAATVFTVGIVGTGLLAVPVLAGSAAYAIGEARQWPSGLGRRPKEAQAFYAAIVLATLVGMVIDYAPVNPIRALVWSADINGIVAVPLMVLLMVLSARRSVLGEFRVRGVLLLLGWISTLFMAAIVVGMGWGLVAG